MKMNNTTQLKIWNWITLVVYFKQHFLLLLGIDFKTDTSHYFVTILLLIEKHEYRL